MRHCFLLLTAAVLFFVQNADLPCSDSEGGESGILTPPTIDENVMYFASRPSTLYSFNESTNDVRWTTNLETVPVEYDPEILPAPAPVSVGSYVLVHLGNSLWGVSKIDGRIVWRCDGLPEASRESAISTSNTFPGYYILRETADTVVVTLEEESGWWYARRRMLGDGSLVWEYRLNGEPRGWWLTREGLWIAYEQYGPSGPGSAVNQPGVIISLEMDNGDLNWGTPVDENAEFRSAFRADPARIFLLEKIDRDRFRIRGFSEQDGVMAFSTEYTDGQYYGSLSSDAKIVVLHYDGAPGLRQIRYSLYHTSLNPIRHTTIREARYDQHFPLPAISGNLLLYGGTVYELYDGNMVWRQVNQVRIVDYAADDYLFYFWDASGVLFSIDRLTGDEVWRTAFGILDESGINLVNYGGAALELLENRLYAITPTGEIVRFDPETGETYPGVLRISSSAGTSGNDTSSAESKPANKPLTVVLIISILLSVVILYAIFRYSRNKKI